jgi:arylsulfatase A-like enzyme
MGWRDPSFMGSDYHRTPHMDRLAAEGTVFTQAYMTGPNCAPSRAALHSGQLAPRTGVYTVHPAARGQAELRRMVPVETRRQLAAGVVTLAETLSAAGYRCAHLGKWHLGEGPETGPLGQGFQVNVGGNQRGHPPTYFSPYSNPDLPDGPEGEHLTARMADEAIAFLASCEGRPFFLDLSFFAVHTPIQPTAAGLEATRSRPPGELHRNPRYAALLEDMDHQIGRVLDALDRLGLADDTLVLLTSDNGGAGEQTSMAPLRGCKGTPYEGAVRVPWVVRWPGRVPAARTCDVPVIGIDLYPTWAELCGAPLPEGQPLDGVSLASLWLGTGEPAPRSLYWHFPAYLQASKRLDMGPWRATPFGIVRRGPYKLIERFEDGSLELYDLEADPGESHDLAAQRPQLAAELAAELSAWRLEIGAEMPRPLAEAR